MLEAASRKGVSLEILRFDQPTHTAEDAARAVGAEVGQIVKSLVFVAPSDDGPVGYLVLTSGANRVDEARLAAVVGEPQIRRATAREAAALTGFVIGGIPPLGHRQTLRAVMDPDLGRYPVVWAAAGTQDSVFSVPPATLRNIANAVVAPVAADPEDGRGAATDGAGPTDGRPTDGLTAADGRAAATSRA